MFFMKWFYKALFFKRAFRLYRKSLLRYIIPILDQALIPPYNNFEKNYYWYRDTLIVFVDSFTIPLYNKFEKWYVFHFKRVVRRVDAVVIPLYNRFEKKFVLFYEEIKKFVFF